ncbi:MAG TPA: LytR C-terminal domain-containing protein [Acidimicrobiales bacterium]|nr:LytR C-terminal domain-containing protein [Acidimicrobiales bacterium]
MPTTERPPTRPARGSSPMRGVALVAVAVVLGFFVLRAIDDTGGGPSAAEVGAPGTTEAASSRTTAPPPSEPSTPAPHPPGEVVVLVANGSGVQGAAGTQAQAIQDGGYQVLPAANAPQRVEATQVLATPGFEADAEALARAIGAPPGAVAAMPDPPPLDLAGADVLVVLGPDLAQG